MTAICHCEPPWAAWQSVLCRYAICVVLQKTYQVCHSRSRRLTAAQPLAALPPYGCGVPLAGRICPSQVWELRRNTRAADGRPYSALSVVSLCRGAHWAPEKYYRVVPCESVPHRYGRIATVASRPRNDRIVTAYFYDKRKDEPGVLHSQHAGLCFTRINRACSEERHSIRTFYNPSAAGVLRDSPRRRSDRCSRRCTGLLFR